MDIAPEQLMLATMLNIEPHCVNCKILNPTRSTIYEKRWCEHHDTWPKTFLCNNYQLNPPPARRS